MFKFFDPAVIYGHPKWVTECNKNPGGPAGVITQNMLVSAFEAELNFQRARMWAKSHTSTGSRIMEAVGSSPTIINVVAWRSSNPLQPGFSMFSNDSPNHGEGTVFVNLDQFVSVTDVNPEDQRKNKVLNNFVLILHEIGHAKQFIDRPDWFRSNESTGSYIETPRKHLADVFEWRTNKAWGHTGRIDRILGQAHKAFESAIEWDNYIYHEGPICDEIGVARRIRYTNTTGHFGQTFMGGGTKTW